MFSMLNIFYNTTIPTSMQYAHGKFFGQRTYTIWYKKFQVHEYKKILSYNLFNSQQKKCIDG